MMTSHVYVRIDDEGHIALWPVGAPLGGDEEFVVVPSDYFIANDPKTGLDSIADRPLDEWKEAAKQVIVQYVNDITAQLTAGYTEAGKALWGFKPAAARAILRALDNGASPDRLPSRTLGVEGVRGILAEAQASERDLRELCQAILKKAKQWEELAGALEGLNVKGARLVDEAGSVEEVQNVLVSLWREVQKLLGQRR